MTTWNSFSIRAEHILISGKQDSAGVQNFYITVYGKKHNITKLNKEFKRFVITGMETNHNTDKANPANDYVLLLVKGYHWRPYDSHRKYAITVDRKGIIKIDEFPD